MFYVILKKYFNLLKNSKNNVCQESLSKIIINPSLINELILMNKFKNIWRTSLNYSLKNESYKIKDLKIDKNLNGVKIVVKVIHSFKLNNNSYNKLSKEILNYIFFLRKEKFSWKIIDLYNEEYYPKLYENVLKSNFNYFDKNNNSISLLRDNIKIHFWQEKLNDINNMLSSFKNNIVVPHYRSNDNKYNRHNSVVYARKYALNYNNEYKSFHEMGGDCTNYVSQCLKSGGVPTSNTWSPYSNSWVRVNDLYSFLINNGYANNINIKEQYLSGDIIQFYSNNKGYYSHSGIITQPLLNGDYLYCCHSYDKLDFPLSEIYPLFYNKFRILNIVY